jgi:hypothetical protein
VGQSVFTRDHRSGNHLGRLGRRLLFRFKAHECEIGTADGPEFDIRRHLVLEGWKDNAYYPLNSFLSVRVAQYPFDGGSSKSVRSWVQDQGAGGTMELEELALSRLLAWLAVILAVLTVLIGVAEWLAGDEGAAAVNARLKEWYLSSRPTTGVLSSHRLRTSLKDSSRCILV